MSKRPDNGTYEWTNPHTGEVMEVPVGIDPGWDYSPGETAWGRNEALRLMEDKGPWVDIAPWKPVAYGRSETLTADRAMASTGTRVKEGDVKGLRAAFRKAMGADEVGLTDPTGEVVMVSQAMVDHIIEKPKERWPRHAYFPFIKETVEDPYEIWISFARSEVSGRVGIRRKYVKAVKLGGNKILGLIAQFMNGQWVGWDFFHGKLTGANQLRKGRLLYGRD